MLCGTNNISQNISKYFHIQTECVDIWECFVE